MLGCLYVKCDDEFKVLYYYSEFYRVYFVNMDIMLWLGVYYVKNEVYEKVMFFFDFVLKF